MPIGTIPIDALFSPIRKVNYTVTNARVGQVTDYDKLTLEVWTNGAVKPDDAVAFAAKILKEQLTIFINFEETEETTYAGAEPRKSRSTRTCSARWTSSSCPFARRTACRTPTSSHRRAGAEDRAGDAQDQELRPQVAQGDQGDPREMGLSLGMKLDNWPQMLERWKQQQAQG